MINKRLSLNLMCVYDLLYFFRLVLNYILFDHYFIYINALFNNLFLFGNMNKCVILYAY